MMIQHLHCSSTFSSSAMDE